MKPQLERETRFELATFCLGSKHSTTELLPRFSLDCMIKTIQIASLVSQHPYRRKAGIHVNGGRKLPQ